MSGFLVRSCCARLVAAILTVMLHGTGHAESWRAYPLGDVTFEAPAAWEIAREQRNRALVLRSPGGDLELRAEWWVQDEPILGYDDIKSHKRISVAGKPATYIHSAVSGLQVLKVVLDEARSDGRKLLLALESTSRGLAVMTPLFEDVLARVRFGKTAAPSPAQKETRPRPVAQETAREASPPLARASLSPQMQAVAGYFAKDCEAVSPADWRHPALEVIRKRKQVHVSWILLCGPRRRPVFGATFDFDPQGRTSDFFTPLYDDVLTANNDAPSSFADIGGRIIIDIARSGENEISVDFREIADLSPPDERSTAPGSGMQQMAEPDMAAPASTPYLPAPDEGEVRVWVGPISFEPPTEWNVEPDETQRLMRMIRPDGRAEIHVVLWANERPMPSSGIERIAHGVIAGEPTTRLTVRTEAADVDHVFFENPLADGSRLAVSYHAAREPLEDGAPLLDLLLASLSRKLPAPAGSTAWMSPTSAKIGDPFAGLEMDSLETTPQAR